MSVTKIMSALVKTSSVAKAFELTRLSLTKLSPKESAQVFDQLEKLTDAVVWEAIGNEGKWWWQSTNPNKQGVWLEDSFEKLQEEMSRQGFKSFAVIPLQ